MQSTTKNSGAGLAARRFLSMAIGGLMMVLPAASHAAGVVSTPTLAAFNSALAGGGAVTFACDGTITVTSPEYITANTSIDATGHNITISGGTNSQIFMVSSGVNLTAGANVIALKYGSAGCKIDQIIVTNDSVVPYGMY